MRPATARRLEPRGKSQESDSRFYDARHTFVTRLAENPRSQRSQFGNLLDTSAPRCSVATPISVLKPGVTPFRPSNRAPQAQFPESQKLMGHKIGHTLPSPKMRRSTSERKP